MLDPVLIGVAFLQLTSGRPLFYDVVHVPINERSALENNTVWMPLVGNAIAAASVPSFSADELSRWKPFFDASVPQTIWQMLR